MEQGVKNMEIIIKGRHIEAVAPGFVDLVREKAREQLENPKSLLAELGDMAINQHITITYLPRVRDHFVKVGSPGHVWPTLLNLALARAIEASAAELEKPLTANDIKMLMGDTCIAVNFTAEEKETAQALQGNIPVMTGHPVAAKRIHPDLAAAPPAPGCF